MFINYWLVKEQREKRVQERKKQYKENSLVDEQIVLQRLTSVERNRVYGILILNMKVPNMIAVQYSKLETLAHIMLLVQSACKPNKAI